MPKKKTSKPAAAADNAALEAGLAAAIERIEALEAQNVILRDSYHFAADELRGLYGMGPLSLVYDAIFKKLTS